MLSGMKRVYALALVALVAASLGAQQRTPEVEELRARAEQGDATAQFNLAVMYHKGKGVPQDYAEAAKWYRKAAEQGHADAQYNLGNMYGKGQGVPQDYVQAHMWFNLAAAQGAARGQESRLKSGFFVMPSNVVD